ncbi:hypothetical protein HYX16_00180 [Candidatus Woesearchaeota archaeon]|nr:hypothetical protein [Candidatus Woesearchaeota archaeon]
MSISVKISEENYKRLCTLSARLIEKLERPVSINETINFLYSRRRISDLAGSWIMKDKEAKEFMENLKKGWKKWKITSA